MLHPALNIGDNITVMPVIHGSGDCAVEVRRVMMNHSFDCIAVPLPNSFRNDVETAIDLLPTPTVVVQQTLQQAWSTGWTPAADSEQELEDESDESYDRQLSYVPIDPCQPVITALRVALGERISREFIDLETNQFETYSAALPDPYALKKVRIDRFATAMIPAIPRPSPGQRRDRITHMASRLWDLRSRYRSILLVCSVLDWPWIREAFVEQHTSTVEHETVDNTAIFSVDPKTLLFMMGELPFITGLYERARAKLEDDENLSIDGVKQLLLTSRDRYQAELKSRARKITPHLVSVLLKYIRNLSLLESRISPDLYTIIMAAKQIAGDQFALHVAETARDYQYHRPTDCEPIQLGVNQGRLPDDDIVQMVSRLPGPPIIWRSCELHRRPDHQDRQRWKLRWNPFSQCSWPPEDDRIEGFRSVIFDRAQAVIGADLSRTEKFTTSIKDGIDIRDTLRNWHTGNIFVKEIPPSRGTLDSVVMLFDSPADPRDYTWRTTWYAEHEKESTLSFFATDFRKEPVGPGIGLANYGGALFLYPPRSIVDVWVDPRLNFTETLEERLLAGACLNSNCPQIVLLSPYPPGAGWRRLAKRFQKRWVHLPLSQFSDATVQQLRMVHVLNGHEVRSYADRFIRRA